MFAEGGTPSGQPAGCRRYIALRFRCFWLEDHALTGSAVHDYAKRGGKLQMADAALLFNRGLLGEPLPVDGAFAGVGVDGEVSDLERGQVLEEMAALRGRDAEVVEAGLVDGASARNFVPLDRDAEPGIVRTPSADSDQ